MILFFHHTFDPRPRNSKKFFFLDILFQCLFLFTFFFLNRCYQSSHSIQDDEKTHRKSVGYVNAIRQFSIYKKKYIEIENSSIRAENWIDFFAFLHFVGSCRSVHVTQPMNSVYTVGCVHHRDYVRLCGVLAKARERDE